MEERKKRLAKEASRKRTSSTRKEISQGNREKIPPKGVPKKRRKIQKRFKVIVSLFLLLVILSGGVFFLLHFEAFSLEEIKVQGTERYPVEKLVQELSITYHENIFKQIYHLYQVDHSSLAYIESLKPKFSSNHTIVLEIKERTSSYLAFNKEENKYYRLDQNGVILEECNVSSQTEDEIILSGIAFDHEVILGKQISEVYLKKIHAYLHIKEEYEKKGLTKYGKITKVNFQNSLTTIVINDKLSVVLQNEKNLTYYMSLLQGIIQKLPEGSTGTIDMTKENPVYSTY